MEPIAVRPADGFAALGVGTTKGYELINAGDLKVIKIGRATRICEREGPGATWDAGGSEGREQGSVGFW